MTNLASRKCKPCEGGVPPLNAAEAGERMAEIDDAWQLDAEQGFISRVFEFPAYSRTLAFANAVAWLATNEGHHPELTITYGSCSIKYYTTAINGLSENDFICAAKIDCLAREL